MMPSLNSCILRGSCDAAGSQSPAYTGGASMALPETAEPGNAANAQQQPSGPGRLPSRGALVSGLPPS